MLKKTSSRGRIWVFGTFLIFPAVFSVLFLRSPSHEQGALVYTGPSGLDTLNTQNITTPSSEDTGVPITITIPSIGVDAMIEKVALAPDGTMGVPKDPLDAGWYELGPRPGEIGSAVIAGHLDWYDGQTGLFADLHKVEPGDEVIVRDEEGMNVTFIVREISLYDAQAVATEVFTSVDGKAHLNLITCHGVWNKDANQYTERLVVFADRQAE